MSSKYTILITDKLGNTVADISSLVQGFYYTLTRCRADAIAGYVNLDDMVRLSQTIGVNADDIIGVNTNEIHVYRRGIQRAAGQISWSYPQVPQSGQRVIQFQTVGWLDLLLQRFTDSSMALSDDPGENMAALIDYTQGLPNGDLGITIGTIQSSGQTDVRNYSYKNIHDAIIELSEIIGGPDFEFTPDKVFNVYSPRIGTHLTDVSFTYPGNIIELGRQRDGTVMANKVTLLGAGTGDQQLVSVAEDLALQATYGLREVIISRPDISIQDTLDSTAAEELRSGKTFFDIPNITVKGDDPDLNSYNPGDDIQIKITRDLEVFDSISQFFRIEQMTVNPDQNEDEKVTIKFGALS